MGTNKILRIHGDDGAGKKTLLGRLIYQFGLELPQLERLERNGVEGYAQLVSFYEKENITQSFHTPSSQFVINKNETPDAVIWVVDATELDSGRASSQRLASLISAGELQPKGKLLVVVNKMDTANWSEKAFGEIVQTFSSGSLVAAGKTFIIPISAIKGDNILEAPGEAPWVKSISPGQFAGSELVSALPLVHLLDT
ncbi:hypothetical protein F5X96DRAFT_641376 [Biscogniauxia mediterranea]|nr:hypothetical protein F5X96DRAFT_641376 [Biscogniauxia mediterranea]